MNVLSTYENGYQEGKKFGLFYGTLIGIAATAVISYGCSLAMANSPQNRVKKLERENQILKDMANEHLKSCKLIYEDREKQS